jgi:hypothetical protein
VWPGQHGVERIELLNAIREEKESLVDPYKGRRRESPDGIAVAIVIPVASPTARSRAMRLPPKERFDGGHRGIR